MKDLIKLMVVLGLLFISTFILLKVTGVLSLDQVRDALTAARQTSPIYLALLIVLLLYADLFVAVPTMTVSVLAGYFLGWPLAVAATLMGFFLAGITGYLLSRKYGSALLHHIYRNGEKLNEIESAFQRTGPWLLIICRALPILPEVSCCMAGATRMKFGKFLLLFAMGTIPYSLIVTYAGSISTLEHPQPAIYTAIAVNLFLWGSWHLIKRYTNRKAHEFV